MKGAQDIKGKTGNNNTRLEKPFNSLMTEFFEGTDTEELIQGKIAHIKTCWKSSNVWEWLCVRSNHTLADKPSFS